MTAPTPIILDTDPGVDDAMAILYALSDPAVELVGLTSVFGNVTGDRARRNALALLELAGSDVPVAEGAHVPYRQDLLPPADFVHGKEGFGEALLDAPARAPDPRGAADFIAEELARRPGEITLVPVGPLTNLAHALDMHPQIVEQVGRVVVMGGAVRRIGNVNDHAEANIWQDPHAAARVFGAHWPMTLVGLDVTERIICTAADIETMRGPSPRCGSFMAHAAEFYFRFHKESADIDGCHLHDPAAVIAALDMSAFETVSAPLTVTLDGEKAGMTREAESGPPVDICLGVDADAVLDRFRAHIASGRLP